jgi:hypothetical protein
MKNFFICPVNDGEAIEIRNLLQKHKKQVVVTSQPWGASWQKLEADVVERVEALIAENPDAEIIGIELAGPARWGGRNIDHHKYPGDDRSNPKSSLEQVAELLGAHLSRHQQLVAVNDKGWIPALKAFGATDGEITVVRAQDRLAQGVTPRDEARAVRDIENAQWQGRKVLVRCPEGASSAVTDRLFGKFNEAITIDEVSGKWVYYGPRHHQFFALTEGRTDTARWVGGAPESGYSGAERPSEKCQEDILKFFWEK